MGSPSPALVFSCWFSNFGDRSQGRCQQVRLSAGMPLPRPRSASSPATNEAMTVSYSQSSAADVGAGL